MRKFYRYVFIAIAAFGTAGCHKTGPEAGKEAVINVSANFGQSEMATRVEGTSLTGTTYGIFVANHGSITDAHKANSWNLRAVYANDQWNYQYVEYVEFGTTSATGYPNLTITAKKDAGNNNVTADLYAYAPYFQNMYSASLTQMPYSISNNNTYQLDYMYALENLDTYSGTGGNMDLDPNSDTPLSAYFTFKHILSKVVFQFRLANPYTNYALEYITVRRIVNPSTAKLYSSGTFNLLTGSFNDDREERNSISIDYWSTNPRYYFNTTTYRSVTMLLVPTPVEDEELEFLFTFNGQTLRPFVLMKDYVKHSDGETYGFQAGYTYTFKFVIDNYIHFDGFSVSSDWNSDVLGSEQL